MCDDRNNTSQIIKIEDAQPYFLSPDAKTVLQSEKKLHNADFLKVAFH